MQGTWVAANQMAENCENSLFCLPDCCATPKEASWAPGCFLGLVSTSNFGRREGVTC